MVYKFFFIKTSRTLDWLEQLLYQLGYATNHILLKVIKDSHGRETDRTIGFLDEKVHMMLIQQNRSDITIEPFIVPSSFYPTATIFTSNFCIPYTRPQEISTTKRDKLYTQQIENKLSPFIFQGLIPRDAYTITIPVASRERNETKGIAFITFHKSVSIDILSVIRYILDGSSWEDGTPMRCGWGKLTLKQSNRQQQQQQTKNV